MGQKTNPIGNRLGIIRGWDSNWYGGNDYGDKLAESHKIRKYIHARLSKASVSSNRENFETCNRYYHYC
jgi:small subunit ribosomal protein S3